MLFDKIEDAIKDIEQGKMVIVVDDENRENEGDFIMAAEKVADKDITFMATHGKGLLCTPISLEISKKLNLPLMVNNLSDSHGTAFTVSIDAAKGTSTGISSADRAHTTTLLASADTLPTDFVSPGHIFPLIAKEGGVLSRAGHTEAAVDLAELAGLSPAGLICEILNNDGTCARVDDLVKVAQTHNMRLITIEDLIKYKKEN